MKRAFMLIGLGLAVLLFTSPALAEFFKYRDSGGVLRFTDNLAEVPVSQRPGAQSYKEADDYLTPAQKKVKAEQVRQEAELADKKKRQNTFESRQELRMNLNKSRMALDEEYGVLMREKKALEKEKEQATSAEQLAAYKKKVNELNKRIIKYTSRREQYEENNRQFNAAKQESQ